MACEPSISVSGSTMGTIPASWQSAAYLAMAWAFARMQPSVGSPFASSTPITARHLANRAPSSRYSARRLPRPSSPSVTFSPGNSARSFAPASTLMPGMIPCFSSTSVNRVPSAVACRMVSSNRMTPLM